MRLIINSKKKALLAYFICLLLYTIPSYAQYCIPTATYGCMYGDINDFILTGSIGNQIIDTGTGCTAGCYNDRTTTFQPLPLIQGQVYTCTLNSVSNYCSVETWIDFNDDEIFQQTEIVTTAAVLMAGVNDINYDINIPVSANPGIHRLRVRLSEYGIVMDPCRTDVVGEAQDYLVNIIAAMPDDIGIDLITAPVQSDFLCSRNVLEVKAVVINLGKNPQAGFSINTFYSGPTTGVIQTFYPDTLAVSSRDTLSVGQFIPELGGNYTLKTYTMLSNDQATINDTARLNFFIQPSPLPLLRDTLVCMLDFPITIDAGNPGCTYFWAGLGIVDQSIQVTGPGSYVVRITNDTGCNIKDTANISMNIEPSVSGIHIDGNSNFFKFYPGTPEYVDSYLWDFGDGTTSNIDTVEHTYRDTGSYTVTLIASNQCGADTATFDIIVVATSVKETQLQSDNITLFPNPAVDYINIDLSREVPSVEFLIIDYKGSIVHRVSNDFVHQKTKIFLPDLSPGNYILCIKSGKGSAYKTFHVSP